MTKKFNLRALYLALAVVLPSVLPGHSGEVRIGFIENLGPMHIERMALGQGGLSDEPMFGGRLAEIRALKPSLIRLFVQEYFDLLPSPGLYHFDTLDRAVDSILATGAKPLMALCFKPKALFPRIDDSVVEPTDYAEWAALVSELVQHYRVRGAGVVYWEVGNEVDIGEGGGTPYRFQPDSYARYYERTAAAIRHADPLARVGGPALADVRSPILPALLDACSARGLPLDFVSWHRYTSSPKEIRDTIDYVHGLLKEHPGLRPETFCTEWNMDLMNPPLDPRFQPCYVAETIWQMKDAGLDWSCYYHIRDWYVSQEMFERFFSEKGAAFMSFWWNRQPQFSGIFDYQNQIRPAYFTWKLISRLAGNRLSVSSTDVNVHGFASHDPRLRMFNVMLWNFSGEPANVRLVFDGLPKEMRVRHLVLDASAGAAEENERLRPEPFEKWTTGAKQLTLELQPWAVHYWSLD